jgi:glycosyltransferase involved in cell wall biosynthesis
MRDLPVAIDARLESGVAGGVESVIRGLASGLSRLGEDAPERYLFLAYDDSSDWLAPAVAGPCSMLSAGLRPVAAGSGSRFRSEMKRALPGVYARLRSTPLAGQLHLPKVPASDGRIERAGVEVVHFINQSAFLTSVPSIYHPHDLQHVHLPQFFSPRQRAIRENLYRTFCGQATTVAVTSSWTRNDVVEHYGLPPEKVKVLPWAPIVDEYAAPTESDLHAAQLRFGLPERFILYPAQTWPHKNHLALIEAISLLKSELGVVVPLVGSGFQNDYFPVLDRRVRSLDLQDQVIWTGFVSPLQLQCLYRLATAVVVPTKFEAASGPVWEAFASGTPVACSNVTSLPDQAGDAALVFDPDDHRAIAGDILRLWTDEELRARLSKRGHTRVNRFSWDRTARLFRAEYRRIAGRTLAEEDLAALEEDPGI